MSISAGGPEGATRMTSEPGRAVLSIVVPAYNEQDNVRTVYERLSKVMEGIGLALDRKGGRMFVTDFAGTVYSANLDGSNKKTLLFAEGNLTGIVYAEI